MVSCPKLSRSKSNPHMFLQLRAIVGQCPRSLCWAMCFDSSFVVRLLLSRRHCAGFDSPEPFAVSLCHSCPLVLRVHRPRVARVMFRFGAFVLLGSCRGLVVSKPGAIADLQDIARVAVQLADGYAAEANAQPSPESVLDDMRLEDGKAAGAMQKQMLAELSAGEGGPCAGAVSASASFLSAGPQATIHLAEPDDALAREIGSTAAALSTAFAALEQRQETTEATLSSVVASASS